MDGNAQPPAAVPGHGRNQAPSSNSRPQQGALDSRAVVQVRSAAQRRSDAEGQGTRESSAAHAARRPIASRSVRRAGEQSPERPAQGTTGSATATNDIAQGPPAAPLPVAPQSPVRPRAASPDPEVRLARAAVPAPCIRDPVPPVPADFDWRATHDSLQAQLEQAHERADWCASRAISRAINDIKTVALKQGASVLEPLDALQDTSDAAAAYQHLDRRRRRIWNNDRKVSASAAARAFAMGHAISEIDRFTHRKSFEIGQRARAFEPLLTADSAPAGQAGASVADPTALNFWIWCQHSNALVDNMEAQSEGSETAAQAAAAAIQLLTRLRTGFNQGSDPWMLSREFIRHRFAAQDPVHVLRRLQAVHDRLTHAMVNPDLTTGRVEEVAADYDWRSHYEGLTTQLEKCLRIGDAAGAERTRAVILHIDDGLEHLRSSLQLQVHPGGNQSIGIYNALVQAARNDEAAESPNPREFKHLWVLHAIHSATRNALAELAQHLAQLPESPDASSPGKPPADGKVSPG